MANVTVSSEAVREASSRVSAMVEEFSARHAQADQTVQALVSSSWTGEASTVFHTGWTDWSTGAAKVADALGGIATLLAEAAVEYAETEASVTRVSVSSTVISSTPASGGASGEASASPHTEGSATPPSDPAGLR